MTKARSNATAPNAKGTLVVGNGTDASTTLAVASTAGYLLTVDSAETTGLKWAAPAAGGAYTLLSTTAISGSTVSVSSISGSYTELIIVVTDFKASSDNSQPTFRFNNDSGNNYAAYSVISGVSYSGNVSGVDKVWFAGQTGGGAGLDNASDDGIAVMRIFRYAATDAFKTGQMVIAYPQNDGYWYAVNTGFAYKNTSAINRFDLSCSGGWASQGNIYIYGAN